MNKERLKQLTKLNEKGGKDYVEMKKSHLDF